MASSCILASVLEFTDGTFSAQCLFEGEPDECDECADLFPAMTYSGEKKVDRAYLRIFLREEWEALRSAAAP